MTKEEPDREAEKMTGSAWAAGPDLPVKEDGLWMFKTL